MMMTMIMVMMMMMTESKSGKVWLGANCLGDRRQPFVAQRVPVPRGKGQSLFRIFRTGLIKICRICPAERASERRSLNEEIFQACLTPQQVEPIHPHLIFRNNAKVSMGGTKKGHI